VPHFAAEYPDQAATSATIESSTASAIETRRSCRPAECSACSAISLPTSVADRPSAMTPPLRADPQAASADQGEKAA
jgi:hypothetical protein